jgi:hypothetical protein
MTLASNVYEEKIFYKIIKIDDDYLNLYILIEKINMETCELIGEQRCLVLKSNSYYQGFLFPKGEKVCEYYDIDTKTHIMIYVRLKCTNDHFEDDEIEKQYVGVVQDQDCVYNYFLYYHE